MHSEIEKNNSAALIGLGGERILVGLGPFARAATPPADRTAFYAPGFFLDEPRPWYVPATVRETTRAALLGGAGVPEASGATAMAAWVGARPPALAWAEPDRERFAQVFAGIQARIRAGELTKAVPVVFDRAALPPEDVSRLPGLADRVLRGPANLYPYGLWEVEGGILGASPETLFHLLPGGGVHTMALAGTGAPGREAELLADPKERREHELVVEDLEETLGRFGRVKCGTTRTLDLGSMVHILTEVFLDGSAPFADLVAALHPTPALGVAPRSAGLAWLREADREVGRGRFGAPFGVRFPDGSGLCLVAIRNLMWDRTAAQIGSGCGVVAASVERREWAELALKRRAVKDTFGL